MLRPMRSRGTERRRSAAALGASLALHALLLAVLVLEGVGTRPPAAPRPAPPLEITLVPRERAPVVEPPRTSSRSARAPSDRGSTGSPPAEREPARPDPSTGSGEGRGSPAAPRGSASWRAAEGLGEAPRGALALRPGGRARSLEPDPEPPQRDPSLPEDPEVAAARGKRRLDAWFEDLKAIDRARVAPDAYWSQLRERLGAGPEVPWDVLDRGGDGAPRAIAGGLGDALASYQRQAERWAATGRLDVPAPSRADVAREVADPAGVSETARALLAPGRSGGSFLGTGLLALVSITQGEDGAVRAVELVRGSGNHVYDALVLARAQALAPDAPRLLGAPPGGSRRTLWAFATRLELFPPIPVAGCGFDATFRPTGCFYPLKKSVRTQVSLQAVY
jgi:hypothetical protein